MIERSCKEVRGGEEEDKSLLETSFPSNFSSHQAKSVSHSVMSISLRSRGLLAHQAPLSMEFCGQEYWSGLPFTSPGDLPHSGIEPSLLHC